MYPYDAAAKFFSLLLWKQGFTQHHEGVINIENNFFK